MLNLTHYLFLKYMVCINIIQTIQESNKDWDNQ
jgi:hypothetical protein